MKIVQITGAQERLYGLAGDGKLYIWHLVARKWVEAIHD